MNVKDLLNTYQFGLTLKVIISRESMNLEKVSDIRDSLDDLIEKYGEETVGYFMVYPEENYLYIRIC